MANLDLVIMLSLGRSGSTFLAKAISENSDYFNAGENRYFWQEVVKLPKSAQAREIDRFFRKKADGADRVLDKTPALYEHIDRIEFGAHRVRIIELRRASDAIESSRGNFAGRLLDPKRWRIRIRNYRRDYGWRWFIPILQRWYLLPAAFGIGRFRPFATGRDAVHIEDEQIAFDEAVRHLRERHDVITIDYDDFASTSRRLEQFGLESAAVQRINLNFRG